MRYNSDAAAASDRHFPALFSAAVAGLCAFLTMVVIVLCTFITAFLTDFSTEPAQLSCKFTSQRHKLRRQTADAGALHIQTDALPHHFKILLFKT